MKTRKGFKLVSTPSPVVGMVQYKGRLIVALEDGVYELVDEKFVLIKFVDADLASEAVDLSEDVGRKKGLIPGP